MRVDAKYMQAILVFLLVSAACSQASASVLSGTWKTLDGYVELYDCNVAVCGRISTTFGDPIELQKFDVKNENPPLRNRRMGGLEIMTGFVASRDKWTGGKIYNPKDGKTYSGTLMLQPNGALVVKGCVLVPLCKTQIWTRVKS